MLSDLRYSLRVLRRSPGFALTALGTLALGIGANTAVFSLVNAVLLRSVTAPDPDRVVLFLSTNRDGSGPIASEIKYNTWRKQKTAFQSVSGYASSWFNLTGVENPERVDAALVTADYFRLFGLSFARGRSFTDEEEQINGPKAVILSDTLWNRAFGRDPRILGKTISLSGFPYQVVGILAPSIRTDIPAVPPDVWVPFPIDPNSSSQLHYFMVMARLNHRVTLQEADAQLQLATQEFRRKYPNALSTRREDVFSVAPILDVLVRDAKPTLLILQTAVVLVLLIACANVANLLLSQATTRKREIAIRSAIGASRGGIMRQFLAESVLLSVAGGLLGLVMGFSGIRAILAAGGANLPRIGLHGTNVTLDWRVALFTTVVSLITALLFGLIPVLRTSCVDLSESLKQGGGYAGTRAGQNRVRSLLVVGEVSLALLLVIGAVLLIRTLVAVRSVRTGFEGHNVFATMVTLDPRFARTQNTDEISANIVRRVRPLPGVQNVALTGLLPLEGTTNSLPITIIGRSANTVSARGRGRWETVSTGYFDTLRIPLIHGRFFNEADNHGAPPVAIINRALAREFWPHDDPLQDRLIIAEGLGLGEPPRQIVGLVGDVREDALDRDPLPAVYVPLLQRKYGGPDVADAFSVVRMWVVVRTRGESRLLNSAILNELRTATGDLPVASLRSMNEVLLRSTAEQSFHMTSMIIFGACALLLASIGIYGLITCSVQQRAREIGIRLALGATPRAVRNMVIFDGLRLAVVGMSGGIIAALALTRFLRHLLFGVTSLDPVTFLAVPLLLMAVTLIAVWIPAHRAAALDPMVTLRQE